MFKLESKFKALDKIYGLYDRFAESLVIACKKSCASCCTCNATLTTLEGYWIVDHLIRAGKLELLNRIALQSGMNRFQPKMTTNRIAELCAAGVEPPDDRNDSPRGICAFLRENLCDIYLFRPFGCRCLLSRIHCRDTGTADIDAFVLSVNTLFLQVIEHVDADGYFGNLLDILGFLSIEKHREDYDEGSLTVSDVPLIKNRPLTKLFIPPEHRVRIQPLLRSLQGIRV